LFLTVSVTCFVNVAFTVVSELIVRVHVVFVPEQPPPDQPANVEPFDGFAVSVTDVPKSKFWEQSFPQLIPDGFEVTVPSPEPGVVTVSFSCTSVNIAVAVVSEVRVSLHVAPVAFEQAPPQPLNAEPGSPSAVSVTWVP